jgi:hypothetical protein
MVDQTSLIDVTSRLSAIQARKILAEIFNKNPNFISFTKHAFEQMHDDDLKTGDVLNVLKAGKIYDNPEFENGSFRYRVETRRIIVVIAFRRPNHVVVITTWRNK